MKKLFTILGVIFATIIVIMVIIAAIFIPYNLKLNREATTYIENAVPKIVTNWKSQELVDRATPELIESGKSRDKVDDLFVLFQRLGSLKHLDTPKGMVVSGTYTGSGMVTYGNYSVHAEFEKGPATINIQLRRVKDTWQINVFRINSDVLLPSKA